MTQQEKILYHQIHPAKLVTDISVTFISLYFFWVHNIILGIITGFVPPIIASYLIIRFVSLEYLRESHFGKYIKKYMNNVATFLRVFGLLIAIFGAWEHNWLFIIFGHLIILLAWTYGLILNKFK